MKVEGKIKKLSERFSGTSEAGLVYDFQVAVVEWDEKCIGHSGEFIRHHEAIVRFTVFDGEVKFKEGDAVECHLNFEVREYKGNDYQNINCRYYMVK